MGQPTSRGEGSASSGSGRPTGGAKGFEGIRTDLVADIPRDRRLRPRSRILCGVVRIGMDDGKSTTCPGRIPVPAPTIGLFDGRFVELAASDGVAVNALEDPLPRSWAGTQSTSPKCSRFSRPPGSRPERRAHLGSLVSNWPRTTTQHIGPRTRLIIVDPNPGDFLQIESGA